MSARFSALLLMLMLSIPSSSIRASESFHSTTASTPGLAFTLISFHPGDLDNECIAKLADGKAKGFTSVVILPSFAFDQDHVVTGATVRAGEIARCLDAAWSAGFNIVFEPHYETLATLSSNGEQGWRAHFDLHPDKTYESESFSEALNWLKSNAAEIAADPRQIDLILSAELETSTAKYPQEWITLTQDIRTALGDAGLAKKVRVAMNLNWAPAADPTVDSCAAYNAMIRGLDFIAISAYGDWSNTEDGEAQIENQMSRTFDLLRRDSYPWWSVQFWKFWDHSCQVSAVNDLPFAIAEVGVGGMFSISENNTSIDKNDLDSYLAQRRKLYQNLFDWARLHPSPTGTPFYLNIWTLGVFDPVGINPDDETVADLEIVKMVQEYSANRSTLDGSVENSLNN